MRCLQVKYRRNELIANLKRRHYSVDPLLVRLVDL